MKRMFAYIFLALGAGAVAANADNWVRDAEPAILEVHYTRTEVTDTTKRETNYFNEETMLRIGDSMSLYCSVPRFYRDSLMFNNRALYFQMEAASFEKDPREHDRTSLERSGRYGSFIYKNYPEGKITTLALLGTTECLMEEEYISQDWKLADSTKIIHGYQCRLAECHFRGRNYHAWFAPEIPLNEGPWKFNGLPGLILEVYDTQDHYHFTLIGMQQEGTEPVCYYNFRPNYEKIDRIKYLKMSASRTHKGVDPEIKKVLNLDKMTPKTKNAQGQTIACDFMEKDYR